MYPGVYNSIEANRSFASQLHTSRSITHTPNHSLSLGERSVSSCRWLSKKRRQCHVRPMLRAPVPRQNRRLHPNLAQRDAPVRQKRRKVGTPPVCSSTVRPGKPSLSTSGRRKLMCKQAAIWGAPMSKASKTWSPASWAHGQRWIWSIMKSPAMPGRSCRPACNRSRLGKPLSG